KDPKARMRDVGEARLQIEELISGTVEEIPAAIAARPVAPQPRWRRSIPVAAAAVVSGAIVGSAAWALRPSPPSAPVARFAIALGEGQQFGTTNFPSIGISRDGTRLVYVANRQLYLRSLTDLEARPIPGLQQLAPTTPVFSPDGQSIAFFVGTEQTIKKIAVSGGAPVTICRAQVPFLGMSWDSGGLVFGQRDKGIMRVSSNGGEPTLIAGVKSGEIAASPQVLPGGEWVLFTIAAAP